jgi:EmrB/QacA subfamily drug resistance transporter
MLLGPIFGPILGGWLIDAASWHWIFLINLPIGLAALVYSAIALPKDSVQPSEKFDWVGMLLLSPGLAAFLYGVSSIPEAGTIWAAKVLVPALAGLVLIAAFVPWALRRNNIHPLVQLRLFANRDMTIAVIAMALFATAFFGASLLFPLYFQQVRGEDALHAGLLLAPQGLGAMLTMPAAGILADRIGPGKIVIAGILLITGAMAAFTTITDTTPYAQLLAALFVMGLGMGCTMMPIMASALATLSDHNIARGSTLMNIVQQVAASTGTALFSVLLTNNVKATDYPRLVGLQLQLPHLSGEQLQSAQTEVATLAGQVMSQLANAYADVFVVATVLVACVLIPAFMLPRRKADKAVEPAAMMGH